MFNIVAEIPGTDKADDIVMLGAHFDSWQCGTGATDNAAGSAVMMEVMRILEQSGLKTRGTVRLALWTGEEQGLLGSRAYGEAHFGDPETMQLKPEHAKLAGCFNMDHGTGAYRGVYLQSNVAAAPVFKSWVAAFENLGMTHLTIATRVALTICRTTPWGCRAFSSSRTKCSTARARTIPTWMSTTSSCPPT